MTTPSSPAVAQPAEPDGPGPAERRAARRANQTTFNLVLALLASLAIVAFLVAVVVRPDMSPPTVDYRETGAGAQSVDARFIVPELPADWAANRSEIFADPSDGVVRWETGFLTPGGDFITMVQGIEANESWVASQVVEARTDDDIRLGGLDWDVYDRRDVDDPGNRAYMLVTTVDAVTVVLFGTAGDAEFATLAAAIVEAGP